MSQRKTNNNFTINNSDSKASEAEYDDDIPFYQYSKFENVKLISKNVYKAHIKKIDLQQEKTAVEVALKYISLNNFINEVKRYRKLEINDNILKFYGITKQENTNNYMIVFEYANNGSLRQYLKTNFQKFDWNIKLNLAKQIANALMDLHDNNIIHGKLTSESILVHNGTIKLNNFGINYLKSLTTTVTIPIQYTDFKYLELFNKSLDIYSLGIILWEITNDENTNNYMIVFEYANNGSLRQYLKTNFQKFDWNIKLNLAKQIANALMDLHDNNIIHGKLTSESILVHNGTIKLNNFGINYLKSLTTTVTIPIQYTDFKYLELFNKSLDIYSLGIILWEISNDGISPFENEFMSKSALPSSTSTSTSTNSNIIDLINDIIIKEKREKTTFGIPPKYKEIYTDCLQRHGNSRPNIFEVVNDLSEINVTNSLENSNEEGIQFNHPSINSIATKTNNYNITFIKNLFEFFIDIYNNQSKAVQLIMFKNYIREHNLNPVKIFHTMIRHHFNYWFTSLIGYLYKNGIGTAIDNQMSFKFFSLAANERIYMNNTSSDLSLRKFCHINKEMGITHLAHMYFHGIGVEKDLKKSFQIYSKVANEGSNIALNFTAYCYCKGLGVGKDEEKAFELYLKSAEKGNPVAQFNVNECYIDGTGITKDKVKGFKLHLKSALAGNINAINNTGYCYENGIGVGVDKKEAFRWYFKGAEKGNPMTQQNLGRYYANGYGINQDQVKAFEWYKKAAENDDIKSQYAIGRHFYEGRGASKDIIKAIRWLGKAKGNGNIIANRLLDEIIDRMI
ncbi:hypothetical protein Glove_350g100 [Diversispora epigaea]|uniref:Protein kinase domain-containing protein n=1 Tax=Diversispora epigaea TaxID=1348612 RepID=A0A397HKC6_9GLOM|nr:hypothetical protein Glove_350g100 [Diversispora epigaea]